LSVFVLILVLECRTTKRGLDYRGKLSTTNMGRTCQAWSVLTPHNHKFQRELLTEKNYCRNPDNTSGGPWCYTTDVSQRWEFCDVPYCGMYFKTDLQKNIIFGYFLLLNRNRE
jgi:hypothetical protein